MPNRLWWLYAGCFMPSRWRLLYVAIRDWFWWGWRDGIEAGAAVSLFLVVAMALEFLLRRAAIVVMALLAVTAFLSALLFLGVLLARAWGDVAFTLLWLAGSIFGFIHSQRLSKSMRKTK